MSLEYIKIWEIGGNISFENLLLNAQINDVIKYGKNYLLIKTTDNSEIITLGRSGTSTNIHYLFRKITLENLDKKDKISKLKTMNITELPRILFKEFAQKLSKEKRIFVDIKKCYLEGTKILNYCYENQLEATA